MKLSLPAAQLCNYVHRMVANTIPDNYAPDPRSTRLFSLALDRTEHCFKHIHRKYYSDKNELVFDHLNGDHMATLLYFYANTVWREASDQCLATRLFYLNKAMHGLDLFYTINMPDIFLLVHPVGTVIGNAKYKDYFVIYQNCTVGAVTEVYPSFGEGTVLYSGSSVLGNCNLGDDVVIAANCFLINMNVPPNTTVTGQYPMQRFLPNVKSVRSRCFDNPEAGVAV